MSLITKAKAMGLLALSFALMMPADAAANPSPVSIVLTELGVNLDELSNFNPITPPDFKTNDPSIRQTQFSVNGITVTLTGKNFNSDSQISMVTLNLGKKSGKADSFVNLFDSTYSPSSNARNRKSWEFPTTENLGWQSQETRASLFENSDKNYIFTVDRRGIGPGNTKGGPVPTINEPLVTDTAKKRRNIKKRNDF